MAGQEVPELALETTVLNRLAILEALCSSQAHTIKRLQLEVDCLRGIPAASPPAEVLCSTIMYYTSA